jgi:hypothetical protein
MIGKRSRGEDEAAAFAEHIYFSEANKQNFMFQLKKNFTESGQRFTGQNDADLIQIPVFDRRSGR